VSKKQYRYPGAQPFSVSQENIFFGRDKDVEDFYELLTLEELIVLYSKSGLGKSSLLNAGVKPKLAEEGKYEVLDIRFGSYTEDQEESPLDICRERLRSSHPGPSLLDKIIEEENSIWYNLKKYSLNHPQKGYVLIFDQFEELFTYPDEAITEFKKELAELMYTDIPERFRKSFELQFTSKEALLTDEELDIIHKPLGVKVVFAIRSDRMSLLNNFSDHFPSILKSCYELGPLAVKDAEEAILNPAFKKGDNFISPPFDYEDEAIEEILAYLTKNRTEKIESFQLQILCQALEKKVLRQKLEKITTKETKDIESIYANYYDNQIAQLDTPQDRFAARKLIEEGLIFEEEERRLNIYEGQIYKTFGFTPDLLRKLVDVHLLRAEPSLKGGYTYEITHDTIVPPILKAKRQRLEEERKLAEEAALLEREKELAELKEQAAIERQKRMRARLIASVAVFFAVIAVISSLYAYQSLMVAEAAQLEAEKEKEVAQNLNEVLEQQIRLSKEAEYNRLVALANQYKAEAKFEQALQTFEEAKLVIRDYPEIDNQGVQAKQGSEQVIQAMDNSGAFLSLLAEGESLENRGPQYYRSAEQKYRAAKLLDVSKTDINRAQNKIDALLIKIESSFQNFKKRGDLYQRENNKSAACDNYEKARQLKPKDEYIAEMLRKHCQ
jgi:hypothetical protein